MIDPTPNETAAMVEGGKAGGAYLDSLGRTDLALLREEFQPLSDHRAGAGYRRALCASLFAKFAAEHLPGAAP